MPTLEDLRASLRANENPLGGGVNQSRLSPGFVCLVCKGGEIDIWVKKDWPGLIVGLAENVACPNCTHVPCPKWPGLGRTASGGSVLAAITMPEVSALVSTDALKFGSLLLSPVQATDEKPKWAKYVRGIVDLGPVQHNSWMFLQGENIPNAIVYGYDICHVTANAIYIWRPAKDSYTQVDEIVAYLEDLSTAAFGSTRVWVSTKSACYVKSKSGGAWKLNDALS